MSGVCPECGQGKHRNCDGHAWDFDTDEPCGCKCADAGHDDNTTSEGDARV